MFSNTCINNIGSLQKWKIGNDVRALLLDNAELVDRVGTDIFPIVAPENTDGEFILYQRDKYRKSWVKQGVYEDECHLLITAVADDYDAALDLAEMIDNTLTGKHINNEGKQFSMDLIDSTEEYSDNKYVETLLFEIK